jgi:hypothetical protein
MYISYGLSLLRFSSAALAFENCDEKYKAVFAGKKIFYIDDIMKAWAWRSV